MKTIERLKQLLAEATQGEWFDDGEDVFCDGTTIAYDGKPHNTKFIAESHNALPALLAVVEAQAAEIEAWLAVVEAQAAEIEAWRTAEEECRAIENACDMNAARAYIAKSRDNTDAALRALEGGE